MKKLIVLIATLFAFSALGCSKAIPPPDFSAKTTTEAGYSFQGPIDPKEFASWDVVQSNPVATPIGTVFDVFVTNKDQNAVIQYANVLVSARGVLGYYIAYNGTIMGYMLNDSGDCYELMGVISPDVMGQLRREFSEYFGLECH